MPSSDRRDKIDFFAYLMKKYKLIQDFGQGQKYCSDPDVLTLCLTLVVMDIA